MHVAPDCYVANRPAVNHDDEVMKWKQKLEESLTLDFLEASKLPLSIFLFHKILLI